MEIYILRHGVAETARPGTPDERRALLPEGKQKVRDVVRRARSAGLSPDRILTSPYRRALETAEVAAEALGHRQELVRVNTLAPMGSPEQVWDEIRQHKDCARILLVGHEPLLSQVIAYLLSAPALQVDFKKGALARVDVDGFGARPRGVLHWLLTAKLAS